MKFGFNKKNFSTAKIYIILFIFLIFPVYKFIMFEPKLAWILYKNEKEKFIIDKFYSNKIKNLPKNYTITKNKIIFFNNFGIPTGYINKKENFIISGFYGNRGIIIYTKTDGKISYYNKDGNKNWDYDTYSYPFVVNTNLILLITGENAGFKVIDRNKNELSDFTATGSIALSFSAAFFKNYIAIGFSDGYLSFYNEKLKLLWNKRLLFDSIYPIIKKVAVSARGNYIGVLSGLQNEYIYIFNNEGKEIYSYKTGENRRRSIGLKFSLNEKYLLEESGTGFRLYSIEKKELVLSKKLFKKSYKRQIISFDISRTGRYIIVAYKYNSYSTIIDIYDNRGELLFRDFMNINLLPLVKFSKFSNSFIIETEKGFYVYEI